MAIKKISEFVAGVPTGEDKILFEHNKSGKSATISDVRSAMGINKLAQTNLLRPSPVNVTGDGITCTYNNDGTFTFNGTATKNITYTLAYIGKMENRKLVGCPANTTGMYLAILRNGSWTNIIQDRGNGAEVTLTTEGNSVIIGIEQGTIVDNVVFKPMITTDLSATYDDFVSWEESNTKNKQLSTVATSGSYNDLSNKPSLATVATSGSYADLSNKPTIPTKTSQLTNDSGFITSLVASNSPIWVQGGSVAGGNINRLTTSGGMPADMQYNSGIRGTKIFSNGICFCDPYNGGANSDAAWIRHIEETSNDGYLEIAVGDDGFESIVVRQYNTSNNVHRQANLLDGDGNTSFPGTLTASAVRGAVFNDLVDAIPVGEGDVLEAGYCYGFDGEHYTKTSEYMQKSYIGIHSDTYGFKMGHEEGKEKLNVAISGFVLAYVDKEYEVGTPLTCTSDGHLTEIKLEDKIKYPERVVATYWKNEPNEEWGPEGDKVKVRGRKWVKVK